MAEDEDQVVTRPAADVLIELNRGRSHRELSAELQRLTQAVMEVGKPGTLTLTLTVKPSKVYGAVEVSDKVTTKIPEFQRDASLFFVDDTGNLTRKDPNQQELPLHDVSDRREERASND